MCWVCSEVEQSKPPVSPVVLVWEDALGIVSGEIREWIGSK